MSLNVVRKSYHRFPRPLTPSERDILILLSRGLTMKEVAVERGTTYDVIDKHMYHARMRSGTRTTPELMFKYAKGEVK